MNDEIIYLNDFSKTRETMSKRPIRCMSIFVYLFFATLVLFLVWAAFMELDISINATGETSTDSLYTVSTSQEDGIIKSLLLKTNGHVQKGETILVIESWKDDGALQLDVSAEDTGTLLLADTTVSGAKVSKGQVLYRIVPDNGNSILNVSIPEGYYEDVYIGQPVMVKIPGLSSKGIMNGKIQTLSNILYTDNSGNNYIRAVVQVDEVEEEERLDHVEAWPIGMSASLVIVLGKQTVLHKILSVLHVI